MNLIEIIDNLNLDKIDQEQFLKPALRRGLFKKASDFSLKAALTSLPFALVALPQIVKASTDDATTDTLNFALTLEYLEAEFYNMGLAASGLVTDKTVIMQIAKHENAHVALLKSVLGTNAVSKPTFDFTAKGMFPTVFTNYATFLTLAQGFEDTGVRAYKGQAGVLKGTDTLTVALQIHSVEARHAAEIRKLRGNKGWIVNHDENGVPAAVYAGEDNVTHAGLNASTLQNLTVNGVAISSASVTEAFDEPLATQAVLDIANLFIVKP